MGWSGAYGNDVVREVMERLDYDGESGDIRWSSSSENGGKSKPGEIAGSITKRCMIGLRTAKLPRIYAAYILINGMAAERQLYPRDGDNSNTKAINIKEIPVGHSFQSWMRYMSAGCPSEVDGITVISREDAISLGKTRYFTGIPCRNGHVALRSVVGRVCIECSREFSARPDQLRKRSEKEKARLAAMTDEQRAVKLEYMSQWYEDNQVWVKKYREENADRLRFLSNRSVARRKANDPVFAMLCHCRAMLNKMLTRYGMKKSDRTMAMLGYGPGDLVDRLESQFKDGMGWHNRKEWHIDHICPTSKLMAAGVTDMSIINHLDNLQPMWAKENISKSAKIVDQALFDRLVEMARQR